MTGPVNAPVNGPEGESVNGPEGTPGAAPGAGGWAVGAPVVWAVAAGLLLLAVGAVGGRPDVAVLGVPAILGAVWTLSTRPSAPASADVRPDAGPGTPSGVVAARVALGAPAPVAVRLRVGRPGHRSREALVDVPGRRDLGVTAASVRTGGQPLFSVDHQGVGVGAGVTGPPGHEDAGRVLVLPRPRRIAGLPLPARLRGLTGQHESRRPGSGGGLRDVHPFQPGDSPRRVDWRVTARRSPDLAELYVRRTTALGEAVVTVVVDSRDDVGPDPSSWSGLAPVRADDATSLDLARQAAATLADGYLTGGDRVGIEDLGVRRRAVRSGTGRRQLDRVLQQLALLRPEGRPPARVRPPRITAGALLYVLSTFLDDEAAVMARAWRRRGHDVVAVDVLPRLRLAGLDAGERLALRLVLLERADRLADLAAAGIEVVPWVDAEAANAQLQRLSRPAPGRRPALRAGGARAAGGGGS